MSISEFSGEETLREQTPLAASSPLPQVPGYEVLGLIGRGGMGRVFKARHLGLGRIVALKMLAAGADDKLLARFQAESQAVAQLQHPNIAQVFEAGQVEGQPYYALEFVEGGSLAQKLAGKPQSPQESAALVETIARAIHHSHQNGILHRDLKPANILLQSSECRMQTSRPESTTADQVPENSAFCTLNSAIPKVADFGLAKRLQEGSKLTRTGEVLGTPGYMAPEQATGVFSTLGPGVDVYALGAILYEMLTGRPPFQGPDAMQTLLMVVSMEPVPPRRLQPSVPRDLETICLKCLEKSPRKRYPSALELADDLRRHLEHRPIQARPVRLWERAVKWARRRPAAALLILVSEAAVIALIGGFLQLRSANQQLQAAIDETEESLMVARVAVDRNLVRLADQLAPMPQSEHVRRESLEDARKLYEKLSALRPRDVVGRNHLAEALGKLGKIYQDLGRLDDAEQSYRKAHELWGGLRTESPDEATYPRALAGTLNNLANVERQRGRPDKTQSLVRAALSELEPVLKAQPDDLETLKTMAYLQNTLGLAVRGEQKLGDAESAYRQALELRQRLLKLQPTDAEAKADVAVSHSNLATLLMSRKHSAEAATALTAAATLLEGQTAPQRRFYLAQVQGNLALALELLQKYSEAEAAHAAAIATTTGLVADFFSVPSYRQVLAKQHLNLARLYGPQGRSEEAMRHVRIAEPLLERLVQEHPDNAAFRADRDLCRQIKKLLEEDLEAAKKKKPGG